MEDNCQEVTITVLDTEYRLKTDLSKEYLSDLSKYVEREMREIRDSSPDLFTGKVAVLAALRLTEELFNERKELDRLKEQVVNSLESTRSVLERMLV